MTLIDALVERILGQTTGNYTTPATSATPVYEDIGKYVVVRTYSAGVHVGVLRRREGREVRLEQARRIWSWDGANTLHEIALCGVGDGSKVSDPVASITLTEAIEIIPTTAEAESNLRGAKWKK